MGVAVQGGSISFEDKEYESPKYNLDRTTRKATRIGKVAWSDLDALIAECYPAPPYPVGTYPGISYLYVDNMDVQPFQEAFANVAGDVATYTNAWVTINYTTLPYENDQSTPGQPLITRKYGVAGEFLTIPETKLFWASDNREVDAGELESSKRIEIIEHSITWHRATSIPFSAIRSNVGKVNDGALNNRYFNNVADEALLYLGAEIGWEISTDGTENYTIEHKFHERRINAQGNTYGWNHQYDPVTATWDKMITASGSFVYDESATFNDLFA